MANSPQHNAYYESIRRASTSSLEKDVEAQAALNSAVMAFKKIAVHMEGLDYATYGGHCDKCNRNGMTPEQAGKTLAYLAKVVNETARLLEFAKGNADQRSEIVGLEDLIKVLSPDHFKQVCEWLDADKQTGLQ